VGEADFEAVDGNGPVTLRAQIRKNCLRVSEENDRLVDKMRAQIEQYSGTGDGLLAPRPRLERRTAAVEAALVLSKASEATLAKHLPHREEVDIPTALLEHAEQASHLAREIDQLVRIGRGDRERLIHDGVLARVQSFGSKLEMAAVWCGDDNQV